MLKKRFTLLGLLLFIVMSCSETTQGASDKYTIKGELTNVDRDSIGLYDLVGAEPTLLKKVALSKSGDKATFVIESNLESQGVYYLAMVLTPQERIGTDVVLGAEKNIEITADAKNFDKTVSFKGSKENIVFREMMAKTSEFQEQIRKVNGELQQIMQTQGQDPSKQPDVQKQGELQKQADALYIEQADYHAKFVKEKGIIGKVASAYFYAPYGYGDSKQKFPDEQEYLQESFFSKVDLKDPINGYLPVYYYKMMNYAQMLLMQYQNDYTQFTGKLDAILAQTPSKSKSKKATIFAILNAAAQSQKYNSSCVDIFVNYSKKFIKEYPDDPKTSHFQKQVDQLGGTLIGSMAPEIELESPSGKKLKLSSLKGKIVLIDFWASWCGPCRRENPAVVKMYAEYKDKGFDIFSVSLDKEKAKWEEAIQTDQLTWTNHVSDLQGWQSGAAKLYGVTSIPKTFLIGKDGTIIGKDLRGEALEKKLAQVLGNKK